MKSKLRLNAYKSGFNEYFNKRNKKENVQMKSKKKFDDGSSSYKSYTRPAKVRKKK